RRRLPPAVQSHRARQRPRDRVRRACGRGRPRRLPVPDQRERSQIMSDVAVSLLDQAPDQAPAPAPALGLWALRRRQLAAIIRMELKKGFFGRRAIGLWILALVPPAILSLRFAFVHGDSISELFDLTAA